MRFNFLYFFENLPLLLCMDYTTVLFLLGFSGLIMNKSNILIMLLSLELTFLSSALNFIFAGYFLNLFLGGIYGILIILIVVADTAMGLSLVVLIYRGSNTASINSLMTLSG